MASRFADPAIGDEIHTRLPSTDAPACTLTSSRRRDRWKAAQLRSPRDVRANVFERRRNCPMGARLHEHVAERRRFGWTGDERQPGAVRRQLAEKLVPRAAADDVD